MSFQKDNWPFSPTCLQDLIDESTLSVLQAGCCERLGRPLVLFDGNSENGGFVQRIESLNLRRRFEPFCTIFRETVPGGEEACSRCNLDIANQSLRAFQATGRPYQIFYCHLGLLEATYMLQILGRPLALLYSGQYLPSAGSENTKRTVLDLEINEATRQALLVAIDQLQPVPPELPKLLKQEAEHIERVAGAEHRQTKYQWEQEFLDRLRESVDYEERPGLASLRHLVRGLLDQVMAFCHCEYAGFFASVKSSDTVLPALAVAGLPLGVEDNLPHFNWKKAELPQERFDARKWDFLSWHQRSRNRAIRGDNSEAFSSAALVVPTSLGDRYRGALVFGPFQAAVNLKDEKRFLLAVAEAVSTIALIQLEMLDLDQAHRRWESTARLIIHQLSTALTPVTTQMGRARFYAAKLRDEEPAQRITELLARSEDLSVRLRQSARRTIDSHVMLLEPDDFKFERFSLAALVTNCAEGFATEAKQKQRDLVINDSVELLPEADVDVARLTVALSNLLHNALKYSFPLTRIDVRAHVEALRRTDEGMAVIEVDDIGDEIFQDEREAIFEEGTRGLTQAKMGRIPGSGLGLWEARAVIEAHGGKIGVTCERTQIRRRQGLAYHVVFSVRIPLKRRMDKGRST